MKRLLGRGKMTYYKRILLFMIVFILLVVFPFTTLLYKKAENNITASINHSNEAVLNQLKHNYSYYSETMSALCLSTFFRYDIKELMYNEQVDHVDLYLAIKNLSDNILQSQPSLYSIEIYNGPRKEWYSTESGKRTPGDGLLSFFEKEEEVPKLRPVLRKINMGTDDIPAESYVFSYFMYEYSNPAVGKDSYLVLNQTADWFINNLDNSISDSAPSKIYVANKKGDIYGSQVHDKWEEKLVTDCIREKTDPSGGDKQGFYEQEQDGEKYLISYMDLGDDSNCIVMVQNYKDIFSNMIQLKNDFILICLIYVIIGAVALVVISRWIYNPVNELVDYVSEMEGEEEYAAKGNELDHLRQVYHKTNLLNQKLTTERKSSEKIMERYLLISLLNDSSEEVWSTYYKNMPEASLSSAERYRLQVLILSIDKYSNNKYGFVPGDEEFLLKSAENVLRETMEEIYMVETAETGNNSLAVILNSADEKMDDFVSRDLVRKVQSFMKEYFDVDVSVALSSFFEEPLGLAGLYDEAIKYQKYHLVYGAGALLGRQECIANIENTEATYPRELRKKLEEKLKLGQTEQIQQVMTQLQHSISALAYDNIVISVMSLVTVINSVINEINMTRNNPVTIHFNEMYQKVIEMDSLDGLFDELKEYINAILMETYQTMEKEQDKEKLFVEIVVQYVNKNYADINLSSQAIADHMNLSSRYVAKKFKQCTEISLNEFILNIRMKQAVNLLTNTDMPISQIAGNIGIENENYFYRLFKKVYGCTPREFTKNEDS